MKTFILSIWVILCSLSFLSAQPDFCKATSANFIVDKEACCISTKNAQEFGPGCTGSWQVIGPNGYNYFSEYILTLSVCFPTNGEYRIRRTVDGVGVSIQIIYITDCEGEPDPCEEFEATYCAKEVCRGFGAYQVCRTEFVNTTEGGVSYSWNLTYEDYTGATTQSTYDLDSINVSSGSFYSFPGYPNLNISDLVEVCLTVTNADGCVDTVCESSCPISLVPEVSFPVGTIPYQQETAPRQLPFQQFFQIKSNAISSGNIAWLDQVIPAPEEFSFSYRIVDQVGKVMDEGELQNYSTSLNTSRFSSGIYFVIVYNKDRMLPLAQMKILIY